MTSHACYHHSMSSLQAMEWLIQHQADVDIDEPIPPPTSNNTPQLNMKELSADDNIKTTEKSKKSDQLPVKVNKTKKHSRRRKWEFVPDQVVS